MMGDVVRLPCTRELFRDRRDHEPSTQSCVSCFPVIVFITRYLKHPQTVQTNKDTDVYEEVKSCMLIGSCQNHSQRSELLTGPAECGRHVLPQPARLS